MSETGSAETQAKEYFVPFPPIEQLAAVGDRRTSATIAADGTASRASRSQAVIMVQSPRRGG